MKLREVLIYFLHVFTCILLGPIALLGLSVLKGAGQGGLHQDFLKIDFLVVSDRGE